MDDNSKTKAELVAEVGRLRDQLSGLEQRVQELDQFSDLPNEVAPERSQRRELPTNIHVMGDFNIIQARGINVSDTGICFEVNYDVPFEMEFEQDGDRERHRADLVWMRQLEDGRNQFGFKFVPSEESPLFELLN